MQEVALDALQPLARLFRANTELVTRFAASPEVTSQVVNDVQRLLQQAQESALRLAHSQAFAELVQGMLKNFTEFLTEASQAGAAAFMQGQQAFMRQAEEAASNVVEAAAGSVRRVR